MKLRTTLISLLLLFTMIACVCGGGTTPTPETEPNEPTPRTREAAGELTPEEDVVEVGNTLDALEQLFNNSPFFGGDILRVTNGGVALMNFGDDMWLRLFNDSQLNVVSVEAAENTPFDVQLFLEDGGFTGQLTTEGSQAQFETPNGVTVTIAGTTFFVGYDAAASETIIVNFEGSIRVDDGSRTFTLSPEFWVRSPSGSPERFRPITLEQFENRIRRTDSPIETAGQLACPEFEELELTAEKTDGGFNLVWAVDGGCPPYNGTLTARYVGEEESFATYDINESSGSLFDQPPGRCEGTFTVRYQLVLVDSLGREVSAETEGEILFIC